MPSSELSEDGSSEDSSWEELRLPKESTYDPDGRLLLRIAVDGNIAFILVKFLRGLHKQRKILPRRQDLPEGSYVSGEKVLVEKYLPKWEVNNYGQMELQKAKQQLWVVSHGWLTAEHPDPAGHRLEELIEKLDGLGAGEDDAVFFDFPSLPQIDKLHVDYKHGKTLRPDHPALKSPKDNETFKIAMEGMDRLYASAASKVILMRTIYSFDDIGVRPGGIEFTLNNRPYTSRGWCIVELTVSNHYGRIANVADLPPTMPLERVDPDAFKKAVDEKQIGFTCSGDCETVLEMFKRYKAAGRVDLLVSAVSEGKALDFLDGIQCALRSMDEQAKKKMIMELVKHKEVCDTLEEYLLERLREDIDHEVLSAVSNVVRPAAAITIWCERAKDSYWDKKAAASGLGPVAAEPSLPAEERRSAAEALLTLAKDDDWQVLKAAASSLGCVAAEPSLPAEERRCAAEVLLTLVKDYDCFVREAVASALGRVAAAALLPPGERGAAAGALLGLEGDEEEFVQRAAKDAMEEAGLDSSALQGLVEAAEVEAKKKADEEAEAERKAVAEKACRRVREAWAIDESGQVCTSRFKDLLLRLGASTDLAEQAALELGSPDGQTIDFNRFSTWMQD